MQSIHLSPSTRLKCSHQLDYHSLSNQTQTVSSTRLKPTNHHDHGTSLVQFYILMELPSLFRQMVDSVWLRAVAVISMDYEWLQSKQLESQLNHRLFFERMGNSSVCCHDSRPSPQQTQKIQIIQPVSTCANPTTAGSRARSTLDALPTWVIETINDSNLFHNELLQLKEAKQHEVAGQRYFGQLDENNLPRGLGAIYKSNGSYYVGYFRQGQASGFGFYFLNQRCHYRGQMIDNKAQSNHGYFTDGELEYQGGFQDNQFHGLGHQKTKSYQFNGQFQMGRRKQGQLKWIEDNTQYIYKGQFDEKGKFCGKGKLIDTLGYYEGEFAAGKKEGYGVYKFKTDIRYEGYYKGNLKHGRGQIVNKNGTIVFAGEFLEGVPHGKGYATDLKGNKYSLYWNQAQYSHFL